MTERFRNKYRVSSARLPEWDYRWPGAYFITICTDNHHHFFGRIEDKVMQFSPVGAIADVLWQQLKMHYPNLGLGAFVIMPNHVHGILILPHSPSDAISESQIGSATHNMASISPKAGSVSSIVRNYKSAVSYHAHRLGYDFEWQSRFHDHIIRDEESYKRISQYIINNPAKWAEDKFFGNT